MVGALANAAVGKILKRALRLPRPSGARKTDPGMPSSHATSLSFLSIAAARSIMRSNFVASTALTSAVGAALIGAAVVATVWRVRCGYHTTPQVLAGWILGTTNWVVWENVVEPRIEGPVQAITGGPTEIFLVVAVLVVVSNFFRRLVFIAILFRSTEFADLNIAVNHCSSGPQGAVTFFGSEALKLLQQWRQSGHFLYKR